MTTSGTSPSPGAVPVRLGAVPVRLGADGPAGTVPLPEPIRPGADGPTGTVPLPEPTRLALAGAPPWTVSLYDLALACCAVEFVAASVTEPVFLQTAGLPAAPVDAHVLVVSGTLTDVTAPAVLALYEQLPAPRYVVSFGACAHCGGPYWDSYSVTKGVDQLLPVDVYIPGCPPRPEALVEGLVELQRRVAASADGSGGTRALC